MRKAAFIFTLMFVLCSYQASYAVATYLRAGANFGMFKNHGNHQTDGHQPTKNMTGISLATGASIPLSEDGLALLLEGAWDFAFYAPSMNYHSLTLRTGLEFNNPVLIPYFLIGGGMVMNDPNDAYVSDGLTVNGAVGFRIPIKNGYSVDISGIFSRGYIKYSEKPNQTQLDRAYAQIALHKAF